jgi:acetyltransferase-like isoleucine patch superfamily enzyme
MRIPLSVRIAAALAFCLPSWLSRLVFRLVGHKVGRNTKLPFFSFVCADQMELGNDVEIRPFVFISVSRLTIGANTIVSYGAQVTGDGGLHTGDNCFVGPHSIIHCDEDVRFGFYSGVGPRCTIYTHGSFLPVTLGYPAAFGKVVLGDFVWTAMGVMFLPGAHVESHCIINPGVVVSGRVPSGMRLQMSPEAVKRIDQSRLLGYSRRPADYYHKGIIRGFLEAEGLSWEEDDTGTVFRSGGFAEFRSNPAANVIELVVDGRLIASYDLGDYRSTASRHAVHRRFLAYVRRRFGLTLRTDYAREGRRLRRNGEMDAS